MISGLPTGFEASAAEDTLCYQLAGDFHLWYPGLSPALDPMALAA